MQYLTLNPADAVFLDELFAHNRALYGGWTMLADDDGDDGADDSDDDAKDKGDDDKGDDGDDSDDDAKDLGDKGKQALDRMKTQRNDARTQLREFKALGLSPDQIKALQKPKGKAGDGDDDGPTADEIREQARTEARAEALKERVTDKIEAKASKAFADAEDAVAILLRTHEPDDFLDGDKIDVEAIQDALDELLEKKPHLAAQGGPRFKGKPDGGTRKAARPAQLTRDDLKRMSPQEITKAKADGRLADLLGTK